MIESKQRVVEHTWPGGRSPEQDIVNGRLRAAEQRLLQHQRDIDFLRSALVVLAVLLVIMAVVMVQWL